MQRWVNLVDLIKSFLSMSLFLNLLFEQDNYSSEYFIAKMIEKLASIQPRTGLAKFDKK